MRRLARLLPLLLFLLLLAAAVIILLRAGPLVERVRALVERELSLRLERDVSIGGASLTPTGAVTLRDLVIRDKDGSPLLQAPILEARVGRPGALIPLLSEPTEIRSIRLKQPEAHLIRRADGTWNISDLLQRAGKAEKPFRGTVTADGATLTLVDEKHGGLETTISGANLSVRGSGTGTIVFKVRAPANEGVLRTLEVRGERDSATGIVRLRGEATGVNAAYALPRLANLDALTVAAGTADAKWELGFGGKGADAVGLTYDIAAELSQGEVVFPWLRRPVKEVAGNIRLAGGELHLGKVTGTVEEAPVTLDGVVSNLPDPQLALDLSVTGIRYPQIRALLPKLAFPVGLLLPSPLRLTAEIEGPADQVKVSGEAMIKVIKFRAIPWHDVVGRFEYQDGRLTVRDLQAHGSPRRFEAEIEVDLRGEGAKMRGSVALVNLPLSVLAEMAGIGGEYEGTARANIRGGFDRMGTMSGDFEVTGAVVQGISLGRLTGRFEYGGGRGKLRQVRVRGPVGEGTFDADFTSGGAFTLGAQLSSLDLSAVGPAVKLSGLRGRCCARVEAAGEIGASKLSAHLKLGPGDIQGRPFDSLTADLVVAPARVQVANLRLAFGAGECRGGLVVSDWRERPERAQVSGRVELVSWQIGDWVPARYPSLALSGPVDGAAEIGGTLADPRIAAELRSEALRVAGQCFEASKARFSYQQGRLAIDDITMKTADGRLSVTGGYRPETGFAVQLTGDRLPLADVAAELRTRLGLAIQGELKLDAFLSGSLDRPRVQFGATAEALSINAVDFDQLVLAGQFTGGTIQLESGLLRRGDSVIALAGEVDADGGPMDVTLKLDQVELGKLMWIGDSAIWRLYRAGKRHPFFRAYARLPRPLNGLLTATVRGSSSLKSPRLDASLNVDGLSFNGRRIDRIGGDIAAWLAVDRRSGMAFRRAEVNLKASHELAVASLTGEVSLDGETYLVLDVGNLDLRLLSPWLQYPVELGGLATINFDISGPISRPAVRGDVFVDNLRLASLSLEAAAASPIRVEQGVLTVEEIRLRNGPMQAIGSATYPLYGARTVPRGELHVAKASFTPVPGLLPMEFDADAYLVGDRLTLQDGERQTGASAEPGVRGTMGSGAFSVTGDIVLNEKDPRNWHRNQFDLKAQFSRAQVAWGSALDLKLDGSLLLTNDPASGAALLATGEGEPLTISDGAVGLPEPGRKLPAAHTFFSPEVGVRVVVGENVRFRHGPRQRATDIKIEPYRAPEGESPSGFLDLGGRLTANDLTLKGRFESSEGQLAFPNGVLNLSRATAWVDRDSGKQPVVTVSAEADGRVGDYYVSLNPAGQIYPYGPTTGETGGAPLALNLDAIPHLEEAYVMALLVGPVVAPTRGARPDIATLLADPTRSSGSAGEVTGIRLPPFGHWLGLQELSFDVGMGGMVRVRLGQRIFRRLVVSYVSAIGGSAESRTLRLNYEITPRYSVGWAVNELNQGRWEINAFVPF